MDVKDVKEGIVKVRQEEGKMRRKRRRKEVKEENVPFPSLSLSFSFLPYLRVAVGTKGGRT